MSSATSTQMVLTYLFHGNDFELDSTGLTKPAANNPSLFSILQSAGYQTAFLCATAITGKKMLPMLADSIGPVWSTNDFGKLMEKFETLTATRPFAIYVWNLVTHVEHALSLAPYATGLNDLLGGACAVADHALGSLLEILARKDLMDDTTIIIFGDHGDDYWTHGFKGGLVHGMEPYTHLIHAPLLIRDASLPAGKDNRLTSTVDLMPTILELLGLPSGLPFAHSGQSFLHGEREHAFCQNFTAIQPDASHLDVRQSFSVSDRSYTLLVSSRGLELFNHRQDPTNHCNLLHFFDLNQEGKLVLRPADGYAHLHFATTMRHMLNQPAMNDDFQKLRDALRTHISDKNSYVVERTPGRYPSVDLSNLDIINRYDHDRFFGKVETTAALDTETTAALDTNTAEAFDTNIAAAPGIKATARLLLELLKNRASRELGKILRRR